MNRNFYKKFDGWPAIAIGVAVLATVALLAYRDYRRLEADKLRAVSDLAAAREESYAFLKLLAERRKTIESFQGKLANIESVVETLEKLTQTDEELLKKYSKVYFLNENYNPSTLADIDARYLLPGSTNFFVLAHVWPHLRDLLQAAERADQNLLVASAFRSFGTQAALKSAYKVTYGSGANTFSADQGYSEHQLGTAVDFTTTKLGTGFSAFAAEPAYQWLKNNAHRYGFILSYPENNAFYKFEPWHWRYVGVALATDLYEQGKHFYDLDQREIDKYLIKLFE